MTRCMILDDSSVVRKVARRIMEDMGCVVFDAADGQEALQICRSHMPDVIIIDWMMPGMSGLEFIAAFKEAFDEEGSEVKLIYCTYEMDVPAIATAKRAGATHFLMKPFNRSIMVKKLAEAGVQAVNRAA